MVFVGWILHSAPRASLPDPSIFMRWATLCRWCRATLPAAGPVTWRRLDDLHSQQPAALMTAAWQPSGALAADDPASVGAQPGERSLDDLHDQQHAELLLVHSVPPSVASRGLRGAPPRSMRCARLPPAYRPLRGAVGTPALDAAAPHCPPRAAGSPRTQDADDPVPAAAPAGGRRRDDQHAQQLAAVHATALDATACHQQFAAGTPPRIASWPLAATRSCW